MLRRVIFYLLTFLLLLTGCKMDKKTPEEILGILENAEAYTGECIMSVRNNKSTFTYIMKQYYKKPDKEKMVFYNEDSAVTQIVIFNKGQWEIHHIGINEPYIYENYIESKEYNSSLKTFIADYRVDEKAMAELKSYNGEKCYCYSCDIRKNNDYFKRAELVLNASTANPVKITIYAADGKETIAILYQSFSYNKDLEDSLFERITDT